ncbi:MULTISPECIES: hypothetical protein [unclassified Chamaesiphon]|uniref:hypothetical protein n=1 Tax=unclassified Chamaesiphon TaxID=2620921 RepID=UPI00286C163A|nr:MULTISPECIES: hypothetical protein [unclassified Chamaesiphon]
MSNDINYLELIDSYIRKHPNRQQEYFKFLHANRNNDVNQLSYRFLRAEYLQAKCSSFKVFP